MKKITYLLLTFLICLSVDAKGKAKFKPQKSKVEFQGMDYVRYETENFVILCQDGREKRYADNLEKAWEETEKIIPELKEYRKPPEDSEISNKPFFFFFKDNYNYNSFGEWYIGFLSGKIGEQAAQKAKLTWDQSSIRNVSFPKGELEDLRLEGNIGAAAFKVDMAGKYSPTLTHVCASTLNYMTKVKIPAWIVLGYSYYLEIDICGKSTTTYLSVEQMSQEGLSKDDIVRSKVFSGGRSWCKVVKKLMKDKKFTPPSIKDLVRSQPSTLTPEGAGFLYAFTHFLINGKFEKGNYNDFMKKIYEGGTPQEVLLEVYGYDNIEAFERDWYLFIKSNKFK
jgi:hypothetical protein